MHEVEAILRVTEESTRMARAYSSEAYSVRHRRQVKGSSHLHHHHHLQMELVDLTHNSLFLFAVDRLGCWKKSQQHRTSCVEEHHDQAALCAGGSPVQRTGWPDGPEREPAPALARLRSAGDNAPPAAVQPRHFSLHPVPAPCAQLPNSRYALNSGTYLAEL